MNKITECGIDRIHQVIVRVGAEIVINELFTVTATR